MSTVKNAGFLRIWKVILFMMAMVLFAACFGNTALAASSWQFNYTGNVQSWTCPATGTYKLETWGAQAGYNYYNWEHRSANGAQGGYVSGTMNITQGTTLYICVGGRGGSTSTWDAGAGGYNGGGAGGQGESPSAGAGSGGGGATHIATTNRGVLSNYASYPNDVLIVAAGGGGCAYGINGTTGGSANKLYKFGQGQNGIDGVGYAHEGGGGGGGGWYGGAYGDNGAYYGRGRAPAYGGSHYTSSKLSNVSKQNGGRDGNGYARISSTHTHNSNGVEYNQGNDNQHIKYTFCNEHGSDHSQNRSGGTWENHTWVETRSWYNYDNTTQRRDLKCSKCGRTKIESRTRYYYDPGQSGDSGIYINISVISPTGQEDQKSGYIQLSRDGVNWSSETTDQILSYVRSFKYNDKLYVRYTRPYYDYYEFSYVDPKLPITEINDNTWCYTVQSESPRQYIDIHMQYKPFKVNYILSGGNLPNKKESYIITDTFTIGEPSLNGYTFTGWTMTCSKGKANDRSFTPCNILVPTKDVTISNMYGDITLTANYEKSGTNDDNGHNKTPDDDGTPDHITDTGSRKTPLVTDGGTKHNMFRVTSALR